MAMLGTFIDTIIICTMMFLVIITTTGNAFIDGSNQLGGSNLSIAAFNSGLPGEESW